MKKKYTLIITAFFLFFGIAFPLPMSSYYSYKEEPIKKPELIAQTKSDYPLEEFVKEKIFNSENEFITFCMDNYNVIKDTAEAINAIINEGYDLTDSFWLSPKDQSLIVNKEGLTYERKILKEKGEIKVRVDEKAYFTFHLAIAF